jgi:heat shock protein HslJ
MKPNQASWKILAGLLLGAMIISGCSTTPTAVLQPVAEEPAPAAKAPIVSGPDRLTDTQWHAISILGKPAGAATSTLAFTDSDKVNGDAGCNSYQGSAEIAAETLKFGALATTRKLCSAPINGQETVFLEALSLTESWDLSGDTLELLDETNSVVLRFSQQ